MEPMVTGACKGRRPRPIHELGHLSYDLEWSSKTVMHLDLRDGEGDTVASMIDRDMLPCREWWWDASRAGSTSARTAGRRTTCSDLDARRAYGLPATAPRTACSVSCAAAVEKVIAASPELDQSTCSLTDPDLWRPLRPTKTQHWCYYSYRVIHNKIVSSITWNEYHYSKNTFVSIQFN